MSKFVPSKYQQNIFDVFNDTSDNIVIQAVAGSGKSTTIIKLLDFVPSTKNAIFIAFNRHVIEHLKNKIPHKDNVQISTINSFGARLLYKNFGSISLVENKNFLIALRLYKTKWNIKDPKWSYCYIISKIVDVMRFSLCYGDEELISSVCNEYGITIFNKELEHAQEVFDISATNINQIDFLDQIFMPVVRKIKFIRHDYVFVDECLPYYMPVLLADGTSKSIGEIVENKLQLNVLAYNTKTGKQEKCKIVNWSKTINCKQLFKIKGHQATNRVGSFVVCTFNHKIWTNKGWVEAQNIKPGMILQFETSAEKTQKYKITKTGSEVVRQTMIIKNDSYSPETRKKMREGINKESFHKNKGGNGRINDLQEMFFEALGGNWKKEFSVATKMARKSGYPTCYKLDIAYPELKLGIELDGGSHNSLIRKAEDTKKDKLLNELGWNVIRIKNKELRKDFDNFVETLNEIIKEKLSCRDGKNCPVDFVVDSVEESDINEKFVYDIEVERCHNFYANGILVHNCQDLSILQHKFVQQLLKPGIGRLISTGDKNQAIYKFAGADGNSFDALKNLLPNTRELPLSISYRCSQEVVKLAKSMVPEIEVHPKAIKGAVRKGGKADEIQSGDAVIARMTRPLVLLFRDLIGQGKKASIKGRDIGENMITLIKKTKAQTIENCLLKIGEYQFELKQKLFKKGCPKPDQHVQMLTLVEKKEIIKILSNDCQTIKKLIERIAEIFTDKETDGVLLMTGHKSKGLEFDRVFFLNSFLIPSPYAVTEVEQQQEKNIYYVIVTRAKKELIFIDIIE